MRTSLQRIKRIEICGNTVIVTVIVFPYEIVFKLNCFSLLIKNVLLVCLVCRLTKFEKHYFKLLWCFFHVLQH